VGECSAVVGWDVGSAPVLTADCPVRDEAGVDWALSRSEAVGSAVGSDDRPQSAVDWGARVGSEVGRDVPVEFEAGPVLRAGPAGWWVDPGVAGVD
jgi:hypothetical protein